MNLDLSAHLRLLESIRPYRAEWDGFPLEPREGFHVWNNWFGPVDAEMLHGMLRAGRPRRMIEIGSGMSTLCSAGALALNRSEGFDCAFMAIDPEPRAAIHQLPAVVLSERRLQDVTDGPFKALDSGDVLFIDSSHVWEPGNDVDIEYHRILPNLRPGVVVQCHDIFLPEPYPVWWKHRGYTEQDHLAPLIESGQFEIIWSSFFMHRSAPRTLGDWFRSYRDGDYPASLWMRKQ